MVEIVELEKGVIIWLHKKGRGLERHPTLCLKCRAKCWSILEYLFSWQNCNNCSIAGHICYGLPPHNYLDKWSLGYYTFSSSVYTIYLSINLTINLSMYLSNYLSNYISIYLSNYLPIYISNYLSINLNIYLSINLTI